MQRGSCAAGEKAWRALSDTPDFTGWRPSRECPWFHLVPLRSNNQHLPFTSGQAGTRQVLSDHRVEAPSPLSTRIFPRVFLQSAVGPRGEVRQDLKEGINPKPAILIFHSFVQGPLVVSQRPSPLQQLWPTQTKAASPLCDPHLTNVHTWGESVLC